MRINEKNVKAMLESVIKDLDNVWSNGDESNKLLYKAKGKIQSLLMVVDFEDDIVQFSSAWRGGAHEEKPDGGLRGMFKD